MAGAKEIRTQIASTKSTQKITRAMEMVAASKMRKAQDRMVTSRPYADKIRSVAGHLSHCQSEYKHAFLEVRDVKRAGFIIVSTDRGLCGGLNANLFKKAITEMSELASKEIELDLCLIGAKAEAFFSRHGGNVVAQASHLGDKPTVSDLIGIVKVMLDRYAEGKVDAIYLVYNRFVNTMTQKPLVNRMLPLEASFEDQVDTNWDYIYEPDAKELLEALLTRYIESQVYQSVIENFACQQAATMVAMKSATDNAGDIIKELQLIYNKERQASITQEIAEIVGGAAAV